MKGWEGHNIESMSVSCIVPVNDLKEHDIYSLMCHCNPTIEIVEDKGKYKGVLLKHTAFDARELMEKFDELIKEK